MITLEIAFARKEFSAAQTLLARIPLKASLLVSLNGREAVYRLLLEEKRRDFVLKELSRSLRTLSLRSFSRLEGDFLPEEEEADSFPFRALKKKTRRRPSLMGRMFGFQTKK